MENIELSYDKDVDVLYISFGKLKKGISIEDENGNLIRIHQLTEKMTGVTIIDFVKRYLQ